MNLLDIPFGRAWAHCFTHPAYIVVALIALVALLASAYFCKKSYDKTGNQWLLLVVLLFFGLFAGALLGKPAEVAANTTTEQANRGVFIY